MRPVTRKSVTLTAVALLLSACGRHSDEDPAMSVIRDVEVRMRDGVVLRADIYKPPGDGRFPVLVYRTPYGKHLAVASYETHLRAVERGYAVVLQDVRGRYASDGIFNPYRQEGKDGYDTIEWAAAQRWSNGDVGTFGLSYPGAVQWLAAIESPPGLKAMAPAMTFSSPRNFFYMNGVFDLSWLPWIYLNIAPDARVRLGLPGPTTYAEAAAEWDRVADKILGHLPLAELPYLREEAPYYFDWLGHAPEDPWWDWAEIRDKYHRVTAAALNLSGWYDEAYGPEGAITNHNGLAASRGAEARSHLIMGPWKHGVRQTADSIIEEMDFGPAAGIDYDEVVLRFFDTYLKDQGAGLRDEAAVRYFVMGSNEWREASEWPPTDSELQDWCLAPGALVPCTTAVDVSSSVFEADPRSPVTDRYENFGPHDYSALANREDVLTFDSEVLADDVTVAGNALGRVYVSCDCQDLDLWFRIQDVWPDGRAINMRSPGAEVLRASYRELDRGRQLLVPGEIYELQLGQLMFANTFKAGHKIRVQISASFAPHLSRNLQTGESEVYSSDARKARITVHHGGDRSSMLVLPVEH